MSPKNNQKGFSLIELMVALLVGIIVLAAVSSVFISMLTSNQSYLKSIRLNQELRSTINLISKDVRRAGFNRNAATQPSSNPYTVSGTTLIRVTNNNLVSFAYDATATQTAVEVFGYRWNANNGTIEVCTKTTSHCTDSDNWEQLTDRNLIEINNAQFTLTETIQAGGTIRALAIEITGRLVSDNDFSRRMNETIVLRN